MSRLIRAVLAGWCGLTMLLAMAGRADDKSADRNVERVAVLKGMYMDRDKLPASVGARYHILIDGKDGKRTEVPTTYAFKTGDRFWLQMEVRTPVYVYVLNRTLAGKDKGIAMTRREDAAKPPAREQLPRLVFGPEKVESGAFRQVPNAMALRFNKDPGVEKLYIVLSEKKIPELERGFAQNGEMTQSNAKPGSKPKDLTILNKSLATWANNANNAVPEPDSKGIAMDANGYAVERKHGEPVMVEITLDHR